MSQTVLLLSSATPPTHAIYFYRSMLERMGYGVEVYRLEPASTLLTDLVLSDYAYVVIPKTNGADWVLTDHIADIIQGDYGITVFALGAQDTGSEVRDATGGAGSGKTLGYTLWKWGDVDVWGYGRPMLLEPTFANHGTVEVFVHEDGETATDAMRCWRFQGSAGSWVYVDSGHATTTHDQWSFFTILLQEAMDAGHIEALPKPLVTHFDFDDFPNISTTMNDLETMYAVCQTYGIKATVGLQFHTWGSISAEIKAYLASVSNDGFWYMIDHASGGESAFDDAKAVLDPDYKSWIATFQAAGINTGTDANGYNNHGYRYFDTNTVGETGLQLMQPQIDYTASVDDATEQTGYGQRVIRTDVTSDESTQGIGYPLDQAEAFMVRGMRVVSSKSRLNADDVSFDRVTSNTDLNWLTMHWLTKNGVYLCPEYVHGYQFYNGHDGGNGYMQQLLTAFGKIQAKMPDVIRFGHPLEWVS